MKPLTLEWLEKAEEDFQVAQRERLADPPACNAACFHAQQCAEKTMKALLVQRDVVFPRTHDLQALLKLCLPSLPELRQHEEPLLWLTSFGVEVRYPGCSASVEDAERAVRIAEAVREVLLLNLRKRS